MTQSKLPYCSPHLRRLSMKEVQALGDRIIADAQAFLDKDEGTSEQKEMARQLLKRGQQMKEVKE